MTATSHPSRVATIFTILVLPFLGLILVPGFLLLVFPDVHVGWGLALPFALLPGLFGLASVGLGTTLIGRTVSLFIGIGMGTPAPWRPPTRLIVGGIYRSVRNPMISGVLFVLLGQAVLLGAWPLFAWFELFLLANVIYMPLSEERGLKRRFGDEYERYCHNVPAWIPRLTPWTPPPGAASEDATGRSPDGRELTARRKP